MEKASKYRISFDAIHHNEKIAVVTLADIDSEMPQICYFSHGFLTMTGYTAEDIRQVLKGDYFSVVKESRQQSLYQSYQTECAPGTSHRIEYEIRKKDGSFCWVLDHSSCFFDDEGKRCIEVILTDISDYKLHQSELQAYAQRLKIGLKTSRNCIFEVDLKEQVYTYFENSEEIFGVSSEKILNDVRPYQNLGKEQYRRAVTQYFCHPDDAETVAEAFRSIFRGQPTTYEARMKAGDTQFIWCRIDVSPIIENGIPVRMVGIISNINDIKAKTERLKKEASLDLFSGLYNKKNTELLIRERLTRWPGMKHALILMDLDNFKQINDTYGHDAGDCIIKRISEKLKKSFRKGDIIGRFGGDEFLIFMDRISGPETFLPRMKAILSESGSPKVTKSVGIAVYPEDGEEYETLLKQADLALYRSKQQRNTYTMVQDICRRNP